MPNTLMASQAAYLSPGSLVLFTVMMVVILLITKWLLRDLSHMIIILFSFGTALFFVSQGIAALHSETAVSAMGYFGAGSLFAVIALSEVFFFLAR